MGLDVSSETDVGKRVFATKTMHLHSQTIIDVVFLLYLLEPKQHKVSVDRQLLADVLVESAQYNRLAASRCSKDASTEYQNQDAIPTNFHFLQ